MESKESPSTATKKSFWRLNATLTELNSQSLTQDVIKKYNNNAILVNDNDRPTPNELIKYMDRYNPSQMPASSYGGAIPLSPYSQNDTILVRSSFEWRNNLYCLPKSNPSFRKIVKILSAEAK